MSDPMAFAISATIKPYIREYHPNLKRYEALAPPWKLVDLVIKGEITAKEYDELYVDLILNKLDPHQVVSDLPNGAILLCYEVPEDHCHRHIAADWLRNKGGVLISEWCAPPTKHELFVDNALEF